MKKNNEDFDLTEDDLKEIQSILYWYQIATSHSKERKQSIGKILFKLRRLVNNF